MAHQVGGGGGGKGREGWASCPPVHYSLYIRVGARLEQHCARLWQLQGHTGPGRVGARGSAVQSGGSALRSQNHSFQTPCVPLPCPPIPRGPLSFLTPRGLPPAQTALCASHPAPSHASSRLIQTARLYLLVCKCTHTSCQLEWKHLPGVVLRAQQDVTGAQLGDRLAGEPTDFVGLSGGQPTPGQLVGARGWLCNGRRLRFDALNSFWRIRISNVVLKRP